MKTLIRILLLITFLSMTIFAQDSINVESSVKIDSFYVHEILDDDLIADIFVVGGLLYYTSGIADNVPLNIITTYSIVMVSAAIFTKLHVRQRIKSIMGTEHTRNHSE